VHPADFPETAKAYYHAIQTGTSYKSVLRLLRADGEFRWHRARCEPMRDHQGCIVHWYGVTVDIDEVKKAEEQPRTVARLQANLNALPDQRDAPRLSADRSSPPHQRLTS
jgi:hypothetical protein